MNKETQQTICDWADEAFGEVTSAAACYQRFADEAEELQYVFDDLLESAYHNDLVDSVEEKLSDEESVFEDVLYPSKIHPEFKEDILDEAADVLITLYRIAGMVGGDLHKRVDEKMAINRARKWSKNGIGS